MCVCVCVCNVQWGRFCSSLVLCFPGTLLRFSLKDFKTVPVITGNALAFTFHIRCISIIRPLHFRILSASFLITFLLHGSAIPINMQVPFSLSRIMVPGLLLVCTCWFHYMVTWPSRIFRLIMAHGHATVHRLIWPLFPCIRYSAAKHTFYHVLYVFSSTNKAHADMIRSIVSSNCWHSLHLLSVSVCNIFCIIFCL